MDNIQKDFQKNKEAVVDLLVKNVLSVNIEIPKVVKGNFWAPTAQWQQPWALPTETSSNERVSQSI